MRRWPIFSLLLFLIFVINSCGGEQKSKMNNNISEIKKLSAGKLETLAKKNIFFAHQSVGYNIIDGINDISKEYSSITINIVETKKVEDDTKGILAHSRIGENQDPLLKINNFKQILESGMGEKIDIVALKLCYVDITGGTDTRKTFEEYKKTISLLKDKFPDTTFLHFTVPLKTQVTSWKTWIKRMIGKKDIWEYYDNIKRNEYNELLLKEYKGKEPVFDIAEIESTYPDGSRSVFYRNEQKYYSLVSEYTYDGGHLNEIGRKKVADRLLYQLADISE